MLSYGDFDSAGIGARSYRAGLLAQPTFRIEEKDLRSPLTLIAYGDQRFTDPANMRRTNPRIRQWLVGQIRKSVRTR